MKTLEDVFSEFRTSIENAYEEGVTMQQAERLAAKTLSIRMLISDDIKSKDLDARMKKHGVKVTRAEAYMEELVKHEKKPAEAYLENAVNISELVNAAEKLYAESETTKDRLQTYLDVAKDAHLYFRQIAKGTFE